MKYKIRTNKSGTAGDEEYFVQANTNFPYCIVKFNAYPISFYSHKQFY